MGKAAGPSPLAVHGVQKPAALLSHAEGMLYQGKLSRWLIAKTCYAVVQQFLSPMCDSCPVLQSCLWIPSLG